MLAGYEPGVAGRDMQERHIAAAHHAEAAGLAGKQQEGVCHALEGGGALTPADHPTSAVEDARE